jgi:hypothetical protein
MSSKSIYYHYTYLITNIENGMKYIGVRSCKSKPEEDIGVKYFSTSSDNSFINEQKEYPERFTYKVLKIWKSRREANLHEQFLLLTINAAQNPIYYNRNNSVAKFDTFGKNLSPEHRAKISAGGKGRKLSEETKVKMREAAKNRKPPTAETRAKIGAKSKGRKHTDEYKAKMSMIHKGRVFSEETKAKIRAAKQNISKETRTRMSAAQKGRTLSPEHKAKIGVKSREYHNKIRLSKLA